jgi:hypothetical protein
MKHLLTIVFCLLLTASCGSSQRETILPQAESELTLTVLPQTFELGGSAQFELVEKQGGAVTTVEIVATNAAGLKATYIELAYDAQRLVPDEATLTDVLATPDQRLELVHIGRPGIVSLGTVVHHPAAAPGFTGRGVVARIRFRAGSFGSVREASLAPVSAASATVLSYEPATKTLHWGYYHQGDYDQNSETNVADLTPLATRLGKAGPFDPDGSDAVVNGDGNAEINIADLTPIGVNIGRRIGSYNIYASATTADMPQQPDAPSSLSPIATVAYAQKTGQPTLQRLQFSYTLLSANPALHYWVRPADGASEGTPSNPVQPPPPAGNSAPIISSLTATPDTVSSAGTANVVVVASDSNADPLTYNWSATAGEIVGTGASIVWTAPTVSTDTIATISVIVSDGKGGTDSADVNVQVLAAVNQPPVINDLAADPGFLEVHASATVSVDATDPDGDPLQYSYAVSAGSINGTGNTAVFTAPALPGLVTITATVDDGQGNSVSAHIDVQISAATQQLDEVEDNDGIGTAMQLDSLSFVVSGNVGPAGDNDGDNADYFKLIAVPGDLLDITLTYDPSAWLELAVFNGHDLYDVAFGPAGSLNLKIGFRSTDPGPYYIVVNTQGGTSSDYDLACEPITGYAEVEDNDTLAQATPLPPMGANQWTMFNGSLGLPGYDGDTVDYLGFTLGVGEQPHFDVMFDPAVGTVVAELYDSAGTLLTTGTDFGDLASVDYTIQSGDQAPFALKLTTFSPSAAYWITGYAIQP